MSDEKLSGLFSIMKQVHLRSTGDRMALEPSFKMFKASTFFINTFFGSSGATIRLVRADLIALYAVDAWHAQDKGNLQGWSQPVALAAVWQVRQ